MTLILAYLLFVGVTCAKYLSPSRSIDMTHVVNENTIAWPTATKFKHTQVFRGAVESDLPDPAGPASNKYWYENNDITQSEHSGTHTDAPSHFSEGKWRVDQIPLESLNGPAVKVDISKKVEPEFKLRNKDVMLAVNELTDWEVEN